mgnify:CR=1 FL=1
MPIKPPKRNYDVEEIGGFRGRRLRDKGVRDYSKERSPKSDRIYDSPDFKSNLEEVQKDFSRKLNSEDAGRIKPGKDTEDYLHYRMAERHYSHPYRYDPKYKGKKK